MSAGRGIAIPRRCVCSAAVSDELDPDRQFAAHVAAELSRAGHLALFAGGCVRDRLLGKAPKDYDVATDAPPARVREVFGKRRTLAVGEAFGVIVVLPDRRRFPDAQQVEVATFREDAGYADGRRPDAVRFSTPEADAARRDFTVNGLFEDPATGAVIDHVGGVADLEAKVLRAIGDPAARMEEDKLRLLRAVRFAATLNFALDPQTAAAIPPRADGLPSVSGERIGQEMRRVLSDPHRVRGVELLADLALLPRVAPAVAGLGGWGERSARWSAWVTGRSRSPSRWRGFARTSATPASRRGCGSCPMSKGTGRTRCSPTCRPSRTSTPCPCTARSGCSPGITRPT